jgi:hypothetical protein
MKQVVLCSLWALLAFGVQAQVHRCTDPVTGKTAYTDAPCATGHQDALVQPARSAEQIRADHDRAQAAQQRLEEERARQRAQALAVPKEQPPAPPAAEQLAQTVACRDAKKDLEFVSSIRTLSPEGMRARMNAATASVNAACGSHLPMQSEPVAPPITHCDANFCYDAQGGAHVRQSSERNTMNGSSGNCTWRGAAWVCQ